MGVTSRPQLHCGRGGSSASQPVQCIAGARLRACLPGPAQLPSPLTLPHSETLRPILIDQWFLRAPRVT